MRLSSNPDNEKNPGGKRPTLTVTVFSINLPEKPKCLLSTESCSNEYLTTGAFTLPHTLMKGSSRWDTIRMHKLKA